MVALALIAVACGGGGGGGSSGAAPADRDDGTGRGDEGGTALPDRQFTLPDGTAATVADLPDGRPVVLNFFASWCAPCRAEMPDFETVHQDVGDEVHFFGLALNDATGAAEELVELTGVSYSWGLDDGNVYAALGGFAMPTTFYISADGRVLDADNGKISEEDLRRRVADLFEVG